MATSPSDQLLSLACETLGVHSALLFRSDDDGAVLVSAACMGAPTPVPVTIAPGRGLVGWILRNRQPLILNSFDAGHSSLGYYEDSDEALIAAFMGLPLPSAGVLCVDALPGRTFEARDQQQLQRFAELAESMEQLVKNKGSETETHTFFEALASMRQLHDDAPPWSSYLRSLLDVLASATGFDYVMLAMLPENAREYIIEGESSPLLCTQGASAKLPLENGLVGWVFEEGRPYFGDGQSSAVAPLFGRIPQDPGFQSVICVPVMHSRNVCGTLAFAGLQHRTFSDDLRTFVRLAASELGQHIETLYLRHRLLALLPKAQMVFDAAPHDPDTAPMPNEENA